MLDIHIRKNRKPRILAIYSYRYDAHLVPAMLKNIAPLVDGWIGYDDRQAMCLFSNETRRRLTLLQAARDAGAQWVLAVDPDERLEWLTRFSIGRLMDGDADAYWFWLREMYTPRHYRVDGIWGRKRQTRLLRLTDSLTDPGDKLHIPWHKCVNAQQVAPSGHCIYHLKMIEPGRRVARARLYNQLDPDRRMQAIGYDYLQDESGMQLKRIRPWRGYWPRHVDDGQLWMPSLTDEMAS